MTLHELLRVSLLLAKARWYGHSGIGTLPSLWYGGWRAAKTVPMAYQRPILRTNALPRPFMSGLDAQKQPLVWDLGRWYIRPGHRHRAQCGAGESFCQDHTNGVPMAKLLYQRCFLTILGPSPIRCIAVGINISSLVCYWYGSPNPMPRPYQWRTSG